ncbi:tetratricopeptide repeat protein [Pontibacter sp. SGAir0037]|uniref:tetratricopeptide repeat protein n=1 Tax=Pontibacter sp. SGAir0037 TaxID=2571030 RepID=UPI0010CCD4CD|nr:hypothetical protein [Pontibacter sp. SGAir0037]QCR21872.1 hypothetical protein C1N53_05655 [Pontibacter sp. SGAir0037]
MKRLLMAGVAFLFAATITFAQDQPTPASPRVLPMFGNVAKTEQQQKADEKFLSSCDKSFTNRKEASDFFMERGWEYFREGQVDTAVYRFNLAWLLNPDNSNAYWAFGLVTAGKGKADEAITFYEKALTYEPKNSLLLSDLGAAYLQMYQANNKKKILKKAIDFLNQSVSTDSSNAYALYNLARTMYFEKKYTDSWTYLHKSRLLDMQQIDYVFLADLMEKMPDPQGFFKSDSK